MRGGFLVKKVFATLLMGISLTMFTGVATAAPAQPIKIQFNGVNLSSDSAPVLKNGRTLVPVRLVSETLGADVNWDGATKTVTIIKNADTVKLTINQKATTKNGQPAQALEVPAEIINGKTYVPVRFVSEVLGAKVDWDNTNRAVKIQFEEKRDGMSPEELYNKSTTEMLKTDTYHMGGDLVMTVTVKDPSGQVPAIPLNANMTLNGDFKQSTTQFYLTGAASFMGEKLSGDMYFDGKNMYFKEAEQEWVKTPDALSAEDLELIKKQQDPEVAAQLLKELGIMPVFGNDVVIDGKEYYVLNIKIDSNKFMDLMRKSMEQSLAPMDADAAEVEKILSSMKFDLTEKVYINKQTFVSDKVEVDATMNMDAEGLKVLVDMSGNLYVTNVGKAITFPTIPADVKTLE